MSWTSGSWHLQNLISFFCLSFFFSFFISTLQQTQQDRIVFSTKCCFMDSSLSRTTARLQHKNHFRFHLTQLLLLFYILHSTTSNPLRFQQSTPPVLDEVSILKLLQLALLALVDRQASGLTDYSCFYPPPYRGFHTPQIDAMSLCCEIIPVKSTSAVETCRVLLRKWIAKYGIFSELVTDRHGAFTGKLTKSLLEWCGIRHVLISPYHSRSNGQVEKMNSIVLQGLRIHCKGLTEWHKMLASIAAAYKAAVIQI